MTTTTPTSGAAIQRYKIGYHADEWGQRSSTPSGIPDASGSWVRYADHVTALAAGQATAAQPAPATQQAPQQEAQEPCPTCVALARTVMLDQVSFDRKPDCYGIRQITDDEGVEEWEDIRTSPDVAREEADDMMATGRGEVYEVVPLWTTPQPAPAAGAVAGSDDLSGTLRRLDSKELAAWVDRGMALSENLAMYVQADCTLRESQARDMLRAHLFSAQPAPAAPTSPAKGQITKLRNAAKKEDKS